MKFINIETEESQESTQQTINYSRSDYINIDLPYDDLYLMDTVATDSFDNEPKKIELINPINVQGLDKCYQSLKYFTIDNLFSELQTSVLKELARKNLGIDLNTISVKGDIKLGIINLSQLSEVKQIQSELTETNQIAYFIITDNSGKLPSKLTAYSVPTNVVRQLLFTSPNPTALKLLNIVASKVSFSPIGVNVGDLIALTRIKVKVSDLTNVIGITIPGTSEIELYLYKILATNDAKPYNYNGITQGVMGLMSPWDKTEVNKISGIENIANAALPRIDYLPSKWENNMNNCLETGVYPWCTLGRPAGSTGAYTCISIKSSTNDGNYYTIEQTAYGRLNELGQIYKRIIFYKKDGTDTLYHDWINISDSFKTNYYTKDESVELFAKKTSVESNNEKISKILSGETPVEKADKLTTKRTISLSGYAVSNTPYFDGSSNVTISVNSINDRGLLLGLSPKEGDYYRAKMTPIDTANLEFSTNRLAFNKPECITIEYSNDGGNTWLDYEATDILKIRFISGIETPFFLGKNTTALTANQDMLRIKINHNRGAYTNMQRLYIYLSTQGAMVDNSHSLLCKVEKSLCKDPENLSLVGNYLVSGWSGWNSINIDGYFGSVSDNNIHTIQLTFSFNNLSSAYISKTKAKIMKLLMLGNTVFTNSTGCKLLQTGHIYDYDLYKNVIFPAKLTSTILESNIETGTAPIKVKSTTKVSNLKSEYSEKDVNGNIIHTTYATKLEVENEINRAEKIVRKEDIVNNLTDGGADKALSAEMGKELQLKIFDVSYYTTNDTINSVIKRMIITESVPKAEKIRLFASGNKLILQLRSADSTLLCSQGIYSGKNDLMPYGSGITLNGVVELHEGYEVNDFSSPKDGSITSKATNIDTIENLEEFEAVKEEIAKGVYENGNITSSGEIDSNSYCRTFLVPCKKGDIIKGYIHRIKVYGENTEYLGEEGSSYNGNANITHTITTEGAKYARFTIPSASITKPYITVNDIGIQYLVNKTTMNLCIENIQTIKRNKDSIETLETLSIPLKSKQEPANAISGFVVDIKSDISDIYILKTSTGSIEAVYNESAFQRLGTTNVVVSKITSTLGGRNGITIFIPKENIVKAGANFENDVRVSGKFNVIYDGDYVAPYSFMALRYGEGDKDLYNSSIDVLINSNGSIAGLGTGDTTTWSDLTTSSNVVESKDIVKFKKFENVRIPPTYNDKEFVGVVFGMYLSKYVSPGYAEQVFASPALIVGTTIDELKDYKNIVKKGNDDLLEELDRRVSESEESIQALDIRVSVLERSEEGLPKDIYIADIGSSFCHANHTGVDIIEDGDPYMPIDGYAVSVDGNNTVLATYKRKSHMYYIAKKYQLKWANYGYGGTTLVHCAPKAYPNRVFFPLVDERKEQLKEGIDWDYICITLGGNDITFGPIYMRDLWLQETYGLDIGYPVNESQIGADGFATAEQKAACDAVTGDVFGTNYNDNTLYFFAKFLGNKSSTDPNTFWGAWNIVLPYFMQKYRKSKIIIVDPLIALNGERAEMMKEVIKNVVAKWGVTHFDFNRINWFYGQNPPNYTGFPNPDREDGMWQRPDGGLIGGTVLGYNLSRMSYDGQHPTNLGYQKIAGPIGHTIMNE